MGRLLPPLLVMVVSLLHPSLAIRGNYISNKLMDNQILGEEIRIRSIKPVDTLETCTDLCQKDAKCDVFSFSSFRHACELYKMKIGTRPLPLNTFKIFVREKTTDDGYYKYGTDYCQFVSKLMTAYEARDYCKKEGGSLLVVKDQGMNDMLLKNVMEPKAVFSAFLGITDEAEEEEWVSFETGAKISYNNWNQMGMWHRRDKNCAIMKVDGSWFHETCENKSYFFCKIAMF